MCDPTLALALTEARRAEGAGAEPAPREPERVTGPVRERDARVPEGRPA